MTKLIGRLVSVGIGKETVRGTAVTPEYWLPWMELKKDKKNGNIAKAGTELRQILYDVRRLDLQKLIEKSETVQEVKSQLAALESVENSLNTSDKAREAM